MPLPSTGSQAPCRGHPTPRHREEKLRLNEGGRVNWLPGLLNSAGQREPAADGAPVCSQAPTQGSRGPGPRQEDTAFPPTKHFENLGFHCKVTPQVSLFVNAHLLKMSCQNAGGRLSPAHRAAQLPMPVPVTWQMTHLEEGESQGDICEGLWSTETQEPDRRAEPASTNTRDQREPGCRPRPVRATGSHLLSSLRERRPAPLGAARAVTFQQQHGFPPIT